MKKFITNLILLLLINILISVYLSGISLLNVVPAIDLTILVVYAANSDRNEAVIFGFLMGLIVDIFFGTTFGFNTLLYMYLGLGVNYISKRFLSNEPLIVLWLLLVTVLVFDFSHFFFFLMFEGKTFGLRFLFKIVIPELIYTSILYFPMQALVLKYKRFLKKVC
ncbi:MAG: rod shape-determining protein MreD [Clostridia bacterium]|nr:rod shape-determining protein MreD [Clostridia bacterium]